MFTSPAQGPDGKINWREQKVRLKALVATQKHEAVTITPSTLTSTEPTASPADFSAYGSGVAGTFVAVAQEAAAAGEFYDAIIAGETQVLSTTAVAGNLVGLNTTDGQLNVVGDGDIVYGQCVEDVSGGESRVLLYGLPMGYYGPTA